MSEGRGQARSLAAHPALGHPSNPSRLPCSCQLALRFVPLETRGFAPWGGSSLLRLPACLTPLAGFLSLVPGETILNGLLWHSCTTGRAALPAGWFWLWTFKCHLSTGWKGGGEEERQSEILWLKYSCSTLTSPPAVRLLQG